MCVSSSQFNTELAEARRLISLIVVMRLVYVEVESDMSVIL